MNEQGHEGLGMPQRNKHLAWAWTTLLGMLLALALPAAHATSPLRLDDSARQVVLAPHTTWFHDVDGKAGLPEMQRELAEGHFQPLPAGSAEFGFQPGAYWFHIGLLNQNAREPRWLLVQQYSLSDRIEIFARYRDGHVEHRLGGDHVPFDQRAIRYRHPNFEIDLPAGEPVNLYVRVQSESSMQVPLVLYTPGAFSEMARDAQFGIGIYYGILLALFVYNLALLITLRDANYFWYMLHVSAFGLVLFALYGLGFEYLWPRSPWLADQSIPLSICLSQICMQQFARSFLGLRHRWKTGNRVGLGLIAFFVVLGLSSSAMTIRTSTQIAAVATLFSATWIAIESVVALRRGYKPALLFLIAWATFLLGIGLFSMIAFGLVPKTFVTEYGVQIGSAMEMLLLSIALGYRYGILRSKNEHIVREANEQLEIKVQQRTSELSSALSQLEDAHVKLREFVRYDGLTDLYNRTHFREAFELLLAQAHDSHTPISLLMIDLDHFKRINDEYGHLVGDDCLRQVSKVMAEALQPHGALLARFGGEEFIAALPGLDREAATAVAEQVRLSLRHHPCHSGTLAIPLSASIGVHAINAGAGDSLDSALQVADQALYAAKSGGRDCVRMI
ncbi:MAG: diguanylate cyclase [Pseudoxanthomonas sp.]